MEFKIFCLHPPNLVILTTFGDTLCFLTWVEEPGLDCISMLFSTLLIHHEIQRNVIPVIFTIYISTVLKQQNYVFLSSPVSPIRKCFAKPKPFCWRLACSIRLRMISWIASVIRPLLVRSVPTSRKESALGCPSWQCSALPTSRRSSWSSAMVPVVSSLEDINRKTQLTSFLLL